VALHHPSQHPRVDDNSDDELKEKEEKWGIG
jgi:hypothetical protein